MKISPEINIKPFIVPVAVSEDREVPPAVAPYPAPGSGLASRWTVAPPLSPRQFLLSELTTETLEELCEEFTQEVFEKAGKERPAYLNGLEVLIAAAVPKDAESPFSETDAYTEECGGCGQCRTETADALYFDRIVKEKAALDELLERIVAYIDTSVFRSIPVLDQDLLCAQRNAMATYSSLLRHRIDRLFME